ncbi:SAM-dependent methyltransferase [Mesonia hippocampi]|uniref:SAM-dependent methyltransferase n=1 Tax=Mesonia hippocampi TaxID=1628250 RepID=A0A840EQF6_9FLAO|nr:class I SAM-dependent methyltransferase [Mesonia hippocampi]MBB4119210.1 SAM-dependent methyltransferase [Mesonia hippocampi]
MTDSTTKWYASWFDTEFYHILYKDRDYREAKLFMGNLIDYLDLDKNAHILDLACGKGRHSIYLNQLGFPVTGVDLSKNSIQAAQKYATETLQFKVYDMTQALPTKFDAVFNLFTSFGYFDKEEDNLNTLKAIKQELKPGAKAVIDFMNVDYVTRNLVPKEIKTVEGIDFHITRWIEDGFIKKNIQFRVNQEKYNFTERVKMLSLKDFQNYFDQVGISLIDCFGNYQLQKFDQQQHQRLILIFN